MKDDIQKVIDEDASERKIKTLSELASEQRPQQAVEIETADGLLGVCHFKTEPHPGWPQEDPGYITIMRPLDVFNEAPVPPAGEVEALQVYGYQCRQSEQEKFFLHNYPHYWQHIPLVRQADAMEQITRLTAENARLQAERDDIAERYTKMQTGEDKMLHRVIVERDAWKARALCRVEDVRSQTKRYGQQVRGLTAELYALKAKNAWLQKTQDELTKARELLQDSRSSVMFHHDNLVGQLSLTDNKESYRDRIAQLWELNDTAKSFLARQSAPAATCSRCEASTVQSCDEKGCGFLGAGNGEPAAPACCVPSSEDLALIQAGDYCAEELWGGPRPTCPKCIDYWNSSDHGSPASKDGA